MSLFGDCDYVFSATVSPNFTLTKEQVEQGMKHSMILVDLAVPRDFEPTIREIPGIALYDIDCFREEARSDAQKAAIAAAEECFADQIGEFYSWYEGRDLIPRIQKIKEEAAVDLEVRLTKKLQQLPVEANEREELKEDILQASMRAVNKMLFGLRDEISRKAFLECLDGLEKVYKEG